MNLQDDRSTSRAPGDYGDRQALSPAFFDRTRIRNLLGQQAIWILFVFVCAVFALWSPHFLSLFNVSVILVQTSIFGFLAIGLTPVMINGNIDLSVGAMVGFAACLVVGLQEWGLVIAIPLTIAAGVALGFLNGWIVEKAGINSFIVTLAAMIGIRGLAFLYAGDGSLTASDERFVDWGSLTFGPFPIVFLVFLILFLVMHWMISKTTHGRNAYAIGGNRSAANNAGVDVQRHSIYNFVLCGATASLCGIAMAAQLGAATPSYGSGYELWAITAVVLGGTALRGGTGTLIGTLGGVLTLAVMRNGIDLVQIQPYYAQVLMGAVLIAAIAIDRMINRRQSRVN